MYIAAIMVTSLDGRITTKEGDSHSWVSEEDQKIFSELKNSFPVLVMGRRTYESVKPQPSPNFRRIVITHSPQKYIHDSIPNQLEFSDEQPKQLVQRLETEGYSSILIVGGSQIYSEFLNARLINSVHITIEPVSFGAGLPALNTLNSPQHLTLTHIRQINERGTLHAVYHVDL